MDGGKSCFKDCLQQSKKKDGEHVQDDPLHDKGYPFKNQSRLSRTVMSKKGKKLNLY